MSVFGLAKVVGALPDPLAPDMIYAVRTGVGFDLYVSDATGSVAHPLNVSGGGGAVEWEPVTGGEWTISNDATVDITGLASGYDYRLALHDIVPMNDQDALHARVTTDGGVSWKSGAADYSFSLFTRSNNMATENSSGTDFMRFTHQTYGEMGNGAGEKLYGEITVFNPAAAASYTFVGAKVHFLDGRGGNAAVGKATGIYLTAEAVNGIQFFGETGGLASGKLKLYRRALPV